MAPLKEREGLAVNARGLTKRFESDGRAYTAVQDIDLAAEPGTFLSLVGPSGCGKSTILNMLAGLTKPSEGSIEIFGTPLASINTRASYMFQQDALLPWKTVEQNIAIGLQFRGRPTREAIDVARTWVQRVGLEGFADKFPHQ